jgi:RNA polymerase sigma-70 factor (ECF subfamily)
MEVVAVAQPIPLACPVEEANSSVGRPCSDGIKALTVRMVKGNEDAFGDFFDSYSHRIYGYLFVLTRGNEALARELLQQTMIKVARSIRAFDDADAFWNWLARIARNCWIDESRKDRRYLAFLERFWRRPAPQENELPASMNECLQALEPEEQSLLHKKYIEGLSVKELAVSWQTTEKAIESKLSRIRQRIKTNMATRKET